MKHKLLSILIIEDEPDIRQFISFNLKKNNYKVLTAMNGEEGLTITKKHKPDIVILDLMLPGIHGIEVCRLLNKNKDTKKIPIIMLTALGQEENIIKGLEAGADDYITKPFSFKILDARIKSVLRRYLSKGNTTQNESISIGGITINPLKREVKVNKTVVKLTYTEFEIIYLLASCPGLVFTRYQIINKVRDHNYLVTDRSVDFQIVGLRKKMKDKGRMIETIRGVGYRFQHDET